VVNSKLVYIQIMYYLAESWLVVKTRTFVTMPASSNFEIKRAVDSENSETNIESIKSTNERH